MTSMNKDKEPIMPSNAELWEEMQRLSALIGTALEAIERNGAAYASLAAQLQENTVATKAVAKDVTDVKTILQIGRALAIVAGGMRWVIVWVTPIAAFIFGIWQFILWLMGKGPFPH